MRKTGYLLFFCLFVSIQTFCQQVLTASLKDTVEYGTPVQLEEVVITGQFEAQSARNSVYKVTTIDNQRIQSQAAVSMQDVLSFILNVRFSRDNATGMAGISLQGVSGQNVKVLVDGVPLVGRGGVNNEVDLNQINIDEIDRVEIVEGPMAVNYGSDALAGVINIITKKDTLGKLNVVAGLHEETIGDEYSLFSDGIHSPSLVVGYKPHDNWYTQLGARLNRFGGWQGDNEGRNKLWYPKTQYFGDALLRYEKDGFSIYYKLNYLNELLENQGNVNDNNPLKDPFAIDEEYNAIRWMHQLQSDWSIGKMKSHTVLSYTDYERTSRQFTKNLTTGEEENTVESEQDTAFYKALFFRNTITGLLSNEKIDTQIGLEATHESAGGSTLSDGDKHLTDLAVFISAEFKLGNQLKIRPGIRATYNSVFTTIPVPSLNLKYDMSTNTSWRLGYGRGFRAPSIRELYHEFIDSNHNIVGNEDLEPEYSHNINADISHNFQNTPLQLNIGGFYNYIDNRITLYTPSGPNQATTYTNLLKYKTTGGIVGLTSKWRNLEMSGGLTYTGRYQQLNESHDTDVPQFVFSPEVNATIQYFWSLPKMQFNVFYKFTGSTRQYQLVTNEETGESHPELAKIDPYQLLDITLHKNLGKYLALSGGIRNVLDVTNLESSISGGTHGGGSQVSLGYGRSYYLKLNFHLNK